MNTDGSLKFRDRKAWAQFLLIMFGMLALTIWGISGVASATFLAIASTEHREARTAFRCRNSTRYVTEPTNKHKK